MEGCADDCRCPSSSASSLDAPRFLLAAAAAAQHDGHIGELPRIDPDTQARIEALLEAAGKKELKTCPQPCKVTDQSLLTLRKFVSCSFQGSAS